jgi:DNA-binding NarL/FixJ family response regulator
MKSATDYDNITAVVSTADDNMLLDVDAAIGNVVDRMTSLRSVVTPNGSWRPEIPPDGVILAILDVTSLEQASTEIEKINKLSSDQKIVLINRAAPEAMEPLAKRVTAIIQHDQVKDYLTCVTQLVLSGMSVMPSTVLDFPKNEPWLMKWDPDLERLKSLSFTESRVLLSLTEGLSNKQIAKGINISDNTVRVHVRNIFLKLGVQNRTQAALLATRFRYTDVLLEKTEALRA